MLAVGLLLCVGHLSTPWLGIYSLRLVGSDLFSILNEGSVAIPSVLTSRHFTGSSQDKWTWVFAAWSCCGTTSCFLKLHNTCIFVLSCHIMTNLTLICYGPSLTCIAKVLTVLTAGKRAGPPFNTKSLYSRL
jgi:hypothetical protein